MFQDKSSHTVTSSNTIIMSEYEKNNARSSDKRPGFFSGIRKMLQPTTKQPHTTEKLPSQKYYEKHEHAATPEEVEAWLRGPQPPSPPRTFAEDLIRNLKRARQQRSGEDTQVRPDVKKSRTHQQAPIPARALPPVQSRAPPAPTPAPVPVQFKRPINESRIPPTPGKDRYFEAGENKRPVGGTRYVGSSPSEAKRHETDFASRYPTSEALAATKRQVQQNEPYVGIQTAYHGDSSSSRAHDVHPRPITQRMQSSAPKTERKPQTQLKEDWRGPPESGSDIEYSSRFKNFTGFLPAGASMLPPSKLVPLSVRQPHESRTRPAQYVEPQYIFNEEDYISYRSTSPVSDQDLDLEEGMSHNLEIPPNIASSRARMPPAAYGNDRETGRAMPSSERKVPSLHIHDVAGTYTSRPHAVYSDNGGVGSSRSASRREPTSTLHPPAGTLPYSSGLKRAYNDLSHTFTMGSSSEKTIPASSSIDARQPGDRAHHMTERYHRSKKQKMSR